MEPHAGFVEDVEDIGERGVDVLGNLTALCLATGEGAYGAIEAEVAQSDFLESGEACADGGFHIHRQRGFDAANPFIEACDAHGTHLGDIFTLYLTRPHAFAHTRTSAVRTGAHAQHRIQHGGMQQSLLRVDDAAIHAGNEAFVLCRLRPIGGRILQLDLRAVEEEVEFLGRVVADFLVEVEESAVGIAYPAPAAFAEGDIVDGVLVVETLVEVHELVDVELTYLSQSRASWTATFWVVEAERLCIAHKGLPDAREQQSHQRIDVSIGAYRRS